MGTSPFEPFDYLHLLLPGLRIVVSGSAGYDEFPIAWMTAHNIWFCNTINAVAEPTADMALLLTLATVRDTSRAERGMKAGFWRNDHVPSKDPSGLKMGILGLGAIGKVGLTLPVDVRASLRSPDFKKIIYGDQELHSRPKCNEFYHVGGILIPKLTICWRATRGRCSLYTSEFEKETDHTPESPFPYFIFFEQRKAMI